MQFNHNTQFDLQNFKAHRYQMVRDQLIPRGISDRSVLRAMSQIPREEFVAERLRSCAYDDCALPIDCGQTISQPFTVARMIEALHLSGDETVLEIGTGSGYAAAVLACLAAQVHTVERHESLARKAEATLLRLGYKNVHVHLTNGAQGLPEFAPYDAILVSAAATKLPRQLVEQLAPGGRIVIPIGETLCSQHLTCIHKQGEAIKLEDLGLFSFVPLVDDRS